MLESIKNAVKKYTMMGVLEKMAVKKRAGQLDVYYVITSEYHDEKKIRELYEKVVFFFPYSPTMHLPKMQAEIRKLLHNEF
jgi:hypothetical protein